MEHAQTQLVRSLALVICLILAMESYVQVRYRRNYTLNIFFNNVYLVPCATFYESYLTFNEGGESFSTGTFEVSNLAAIGDKQKAVTNWKPSTNWTNKVSHVQIEPQCKLEAFKNNGFTQPIASWRGAINLANGHEMLAGKEDNRINNYKCTCSDESCESYYMYGKDVPKGCQIPQCDVVTYSVTDSWRRKVLFR